VDTAVVHRQRLRTLGPSLVLVVVLFLFINFALVLPSAAGRVPTSAQAVLYAVAILLVALLVLSARVEVLVSERPDGPALEVRYGPGGVVRQVFTRDRLQAARVTSLGLGAFGGWGYRGSLRLLKRAALVTRGGDALTVTLVGGGVFTVSVDDPQAFVDALRVA
jgi:hypothetical protein